jgi:small-conductance mechanosensitive channel/CRP-like cAMP-binding protein
MSHYPAHVVLGTAVFLTAVLIRGVTPNRIIQRKLGLTLLLSAGYVFINLWLTWGRVSPETLDRLVSIEQLLIVLAALNVVILLVLNPLRVDRIPDRFPTIVQDAILIGIFLVVATIVFEEKLLTTSAVGAVVVGFALQDTLGNAFAGLAIQVEKPFHVGHWVTIGPHEGRVTEITWRATKLRTKAGNFAIVPNNLVSKETIVNYSQPAAPTRIEVQVGASYLSSPGEVKAAVREALANSSQVLTEPPPDVLVKEFAASSIDYRVRFWIEDFERDEQARDEVRAAIYYAFRRRGIEIPYPIQVQYERKQTTVEPGEEVRARAALLATLDLFAGLSDNARARLAEAAGDRVFGDGERIVREGEPGSSLFVIAAGRVAVLSGESPAGPGREVATLETGQYFGEMSLLTGEPRSATVAARGDCRVLEIDSGTFRSVAEANPLVLEQVGLAAVARRDSLAAARAAAATTVATADHARSFILRMKRFLRLP